MKTFIKTVGFRLSNFTLIPYNVMWILTTNRDLAGPVGDLTRTSDQPSGKVVLVIRCRTRQGDKQHGIRTTREDV